MRKKFSLNTNLNFDNLVNDCYFSIRNQTVVVGSSTLKGENTVPINGHKKFQPIDPNKEPSTTELGKFIRNRRIELGLSQVELNKKVPRSGRTNQLISKIERGKRKYLGLDQLRVIAKELKVPVKKLCKLMPSKPRSVPKTGLGKLIRSRREKLGFSLPAFAEEMGITVKKARTLEVGGFCTIHYLMIHKLARVLKLDPQELVPFVGNTRKDCNNSFGQLIRNRRKELGISLYSLAETLGVTRQYVNQIELGKSGLSSRKSTSIILKLAQILMIDVAQLEAERPIRRRKKLRTRNKIGNLISSRRLGLRLTQKEVAEDINIERHVLSLIETGRLLPNFDLCKKLARVLEAEISQ